MINVYAIQRLSQQRETRLERMNRTQRMYEVPAGKVEANYKQSRLVRRLTLRFGRA